MTPVVPSRVALRGVLEGPTQRQLARPLGLVTRTQGMNVALDVLTPLLPHAEGERWLRLASTCSVGWQLMIWQTRRGSHIALLVLVLPQAVPPVRGSPVHRLLARLRAPVGSPLAGAVLT